MALVYVATNLVNGKRYVGATTSTLEKRRYHHQKAALGPRPKCRYFHYALRRYGVDIFRWAVLKEYASWGEAAQEEMRLIALLKPEYNLSTGGEGNPGYRHTPETKAKLAVAGRGRKNSPASIEMGAAKRRGMRRTPEQIARISAGLMGKPHILTRPRRGKEIICVDDGLRFVSGAEAAKHYGAQSSHLLEMCRGKGQTVCGRRFAFADGKI